MLSVRLVLHTVSELPEHICATRLLSGSFRRKPYKIWYCGRYCFGENLFNYLF